MNNVSYFPSVRLAFKDVTRTIDNLMDEASKHGQRDVAEAYRQSFELIRRGIEQVEKQGQSSVYKYLENDIQDVTELIHDCSSKIKDCIKEQATLAFEGTKAGIIDILHKKGFDDTYIEDVMTEINKIAEDEVEVVFSEEGIGFSE
mgnify:CR=1 FL=1|tara:strand:+ start:4599 stop:5036 length:438 start_codon:yes stop_codon:yes gene_type:complete